MKIIKNVAKSTSISVMSLGLVLGLSGFAAAAPLSIDRTGPDSYNDIRKTTERRATVRNNNNLRLQNDNMQRADTGDADVRHNTTGGTAETGAARNSTSLNVSAEVDNSASAAAAAQVASGMSGAGDSASIHTTGPDSTNVVTVKTKSTARVTNNNNITITNNNDQRAESGDATVTDNTTGGDAMTGDATNTSSTTIRLNVSN